MANAIFDLRHVLGREGDGSINRHRSGIKGLRRFSLSSPSPLLGPLREGRREREGGKEGEGGGETEGGREEGKRRERERELELELENFVFTRIVV